ncbi:MAG: hypothetical protein H6R05_513 [Burkholderiaceae bacterium]|nr:hypothetical protein [Burkholderiaceae bacterium]
MAQTSNPCRQSIRIPNYDYAQAGMYFVTICTHNRLPLFGTVSDGVMHLSAFGKIVQLAWMDLPNHYSNMQSDGFVVMPNHVHGIITLSSIERTREKAGLKPAPTRVHGLFEMVRAFKTFSAKRINQLRQTSGTSIWQRGYYEHIIRSDESYRTIAEYIKTNPQRWLEDTYYVGL